MAVSSILGSLLFKEKPELPDLPAIDLGEEQRKSIRGNISALPEAQTLAERVNLFNQDQLLKSLRTVIPGFDDITSGVSENIISGLRGELPQDVQDFITNRSAAQAIEGGFAGSNMARNLEARDLGLTSLQLTDKSLNSATHWLSAGRQLLTAPQMDVTSSFVSPLQQAQFDVSERNTRWNFDWFKNQLAAQPEPWEQSVIGLLDWVANTGLTAATMGLGSAMGGGEKAKKKSVDDPTTMSGIDIDSLLKSFY